MSYAHKTLYTIAKGEASRGYCVFINRAFSALKMTTPNGVILYYRAKPNQPINMDTIKYLPACVSGGDLNYSKALAVAVTEKFEKWKRARE